VIINLQSFVLRERPFWDELEACLLHLEQQSRTPMTLQQAQRLHYLYERTSAALAQVNTFSGDPDLQRYVESLVARAYAVIHATDRPRRRFRPIRWFFGTFPATFRAHVNCFWLACAVTLVGMAFGGGAVALDPDAKAVLLPFEHLQGDPADRVKQEEQGTGHHSGEMHGTFAAMLMTHNTQVSILALALGATWGIGTIVLLFYNGAILGAVIVDYVHAGQSVFLAGWLLPHGTIEIPSILIAGQAGLLLGWTMIGRQSRLPLKQRLRRVVPSLVTLILGVAILLVWAGIVESFLSQYHQPVLPYWLKISFGCVELVLLCLLLAWRRKGATAADEEISSLEAAAR
jgi:uncharacterized membrane protein SpoIIM required for sporulation